MEIKSLLVLIVAVFAVTDARNIRSYTEHSGRLAAQKEELAELLIRALLESKQEGGPTEDGESSGYPEQSKPPSPDPSGQVAAGNEPVDEEKPSVQGGGDGPDLVPNVSDDSDDAVGNIGDGNGKQGKGGRRCGSKGNKQDKGRKEDKDKAVRRALLRAALDMDLTDRQADDILEESDDIEDDPNCDQDGGEGTEKVPEVDKGGKEKGQDNGDGHDKNGEAKADNKDGQTGGESEGGRKGDRQGNVSDGPNGNTGDKDERPRDIHDLLERILSEI